MKPHLLAALPVILACCTTDPESPGGRPGESADAAPPAAADAAPEAGEDAAPPAECAPPASPPRGLRWVRQNRPFLSGLTPSVGSPPAAAVEAYFDGFGASAAHLWEDGLPAEVSGWMDADHPDFRFVSWVGADGTSLGSGEVVGGVPAAPGRIGYQIGDEPVTQADLEEVLAGAATVRAADPSALLILNFTTSRAEDLDSFLAQAGEDENIDVFSYDLYTYTQDAYGALAAIREAAQTHGKAYWRYLKSYRSDEGDEWPSESDLRWDAFVGALYGYTGHSWFLYQSSHDGLYPAFFATPADYEAEKTARWEIAAELNRELEVLARSISQLTSTGVRYRPAFDYLQPEGTTDWTPGAGGDPYLAGIEVQSGSLHEVALGFFVDDCGDHYVMVQNPMHSRGNFPTVLDQEASYRLRFDFGETTPSDLRSSLLALDPVTGEVREVSLEQAGASSATVEVALPPGDVFFFKYRTGRPFATLESP